MAGLSGRAAWYLKRAGTSAAISGSDNPVISLIMTDLSPTNDPPAPPAAHTGLLVSLKTRDHYHSERSLYDHLLGTWTLLRHWNQPNAVCTAGLFHSIYGVHNRHARADRFARRDAIRAVIGTEAERLVYLFCSLPQGSYLSSTPAGLRRVEQQVLIEIEVANLIEQTPWVPRFHQETRDRIIARLPDVETLMSPQARQATGLLLNHAGEPAGPTSQEAHR